MSGPVLAVVGRVNKGKSSVIATLAEDDRVPVAAEPGTTTRLVHYPVVVDDQILLPLVDTPGFEQAPAVLERLRSTGPAAHERTDRIRAFLESDEGDFPEERTLLRPLMEGAVVLYVVDGTRPYRENYASEMEILRWTGRPSMALINRIGDGDHFEAWRRALDQYFKVVRPFDAHSASFEERIALLQTFRELDVEHAAAFDAAIEGLKAERARREEVVADIIVDLVADAVSYTLEVGEEETQDPNKLEEEFHEELRRKERDARREVEKTYLQHRVRFEPGSQMARPVFGEDLFARRTWTDLGLSSTQLLGLYASSGAVAGGIVDAGVGGASFMAGTLIGGAIGAGVGLARLERRFAKATSREGLAGRARRAFASGKRVQVGPLAHPNFPFVLLERACLHHDEVRARAHGRSAAAEGESGFSAEGRSPWFDDAGLRRSIDKAGRRLRKQPEDPDARVALRSVVLDRFRRSEPRDR